MNKIVFPVIVLTLSLGIASNLISCQDSANPTKKEEAEAEKIKTEQIKKSISEMGARYNAFTDWEKSSAQKTWEQVYTIDLEAVLVRSDSHPILFIAPVVDVEKRDNKYFVHFLYSSPLYLDIRFVLECDSEQVKKIMNQERTMRDVDTS